MKNNNATIKVPPLTDDTPLHGYIEVGIYRNDVPGITGLVESVRFSLFEEGEGNAETLRRMEVGAVLRTLQSQIRALREIVERQIIEGPLREISDEQMIQVLQLRGYETERMGKANRLPY